MIEHLDDGRLANRAGLKVLHAVLASHCDGFNLSHRVLAGEGVFATRGLSFVRSSGQVNHVANKDFDRNIAPLTFVDPLLNLLKRVSFGDVEHEQHSCGAIYVLMDVFVVSLLAWHVKVYNFVLVSIIDVVGRLDVQLRGLFVFHHCA